MRFVQCLTEMSEKRRTVKTQQELVLLHDAGHLHDGDGKTVGRGCKHSRGQRHVVFVQELCTGQVSRCQSNTPGQLHAR